MPTGNSWCAEPSGVGGLPLAHEAAEMVSGVAALPSGIGQREGGFVAFAERFPEPGLPRTR